MKLRLTAGNLLSLFLLIAIAFFGFRVVRVVLNPVAVPQPGAVAGDAEVRTAELPPPPQAPADAQLAELMTRPPFWESRRPFKVEKPAEPVKELPKLAVAGIMFASDKRVVFLAAEGKPVTRVAEGGEYEGWKVARIQPDQVTLLGSQGTVQLPYDPRQRFTKSAPAPVAGAGKPPVPNQPLNQVLQQMPPPPAQAGLPGQGPAGRQPGMPVSPGMPGRGARNN